MLNKMRPPMAAILAALLLLAWLPAGSAKAAERAADPAGHWAETELTKWLERGDLRGYADGSVKPDQPITRAEWIALTNRAFYYEGEHPTLPSDTAPGAWYASAVSAALAAGYIEGDDDGAIRPEEPITRQEAAVALSRIGQSLLEGADGMLPSFRDDADRWAEPSVASVAKIGWMNGYPDGTFAPRQPITRAEAVVMLERAAQSVLGTLRSDARKLTEAGLYGPSRGQSVIAGDIVIAAPDVTLQNVTIKGSLIVDEAVGEGTVTLQGVTVDGPVTVTGGGENSVYLRDSHMEHVTVVKKEGTVRLVASGSSTIANAKIGSNAILEEEDLSGPGFVSAAISEAVPEQSMVVLRGHFDRIDLNGSYMRLVLQRGTIKKLEAANTVIGTVLELAEGTVVDQATLPFGVTVTGEGVILEGGRGNVVYVPRPNPPATPAPSPTSSAEPSPTSTAEPSPTPTAEPSPSPTPTPTPEPSPSPSQQPETLRLEAAAVTVEPAAGEANRISLSVLNGDGSAASAFNETLSVVLSGVSQAPDGSYGQWNGGAIDSGSAQLTIAFVDGQAEGELTLHHAASQTLTFTADGIDAAVLTINPSPSSAAELRIAVEPDGATDGDTFRTQPVLHIVDAFGNRVPSPLTVTVQKLQGSPVLIGNTQAAAIDGVAAFADLGLRGTGSGVVLRFAVNGLTADSQPIAVDHPFASGEGTSGNPYIIETADQLNRMRDYLSSHFKLGNDIDFDGTAYRTGEGWIPVGNDHSPFTGSLDGDGYGIRNLYIHTANHGNNGLFGLTRPSGDPGQTFTVRNLRLLDAQVTGEGSTAALIAHMDGGRIENVHANGSVNGSNFYTGGLIGRTGSGSVVHRSSANVALNSYTGFAAGGLIGANEGTVTESYAIGTLQGNHTNLGGLIGDNYGSVQNSFARVDLTGGSNNVGGLIGSNGSGGSISSSYSVGLVNTAAPDSGGLIGANAGTVSGSYYDSDSSGMNDSGKGNARTTTQMKVQSTYSGWNFTTIWIIENAGYPSLRNNLLP